MKPIIYKASLFFIALSLLVIAACKKKDDTTPQPQPATYASLAEFYKAHDVKSEIFTVNATSGGTYTTAKGTKLTVPPNGLTDSLGNPITGNVSIELKDLYKKSDILFSGKATVMGNGAPLKSGGEFFIKITQNNTGLKPAAGKPIMIAQPIANTADTSTMDDFVWTKGAGGGEGWFPANNSVIDSSGYYYFSLYEVLIPYTGGTWYNSDNATFFSAYPQTVLTVVPTINVAEYNMDVFLIFKGINTMIHLYKDGNGNFPYNYCPVGLPCAVVAIGNKGNTLYASFTDITTSASQSVNVSLAVTTEADFMTKLNALN